MDRWAGKVAVVTGASAGIGVAIVEQLVDAGLKVAGLARRKDKMEALSSKLQGKPGKFYPVQTDICKPEDIQAAFKWVKDNLGPVHILVNNAGIFYNTNLTEGDPKIWQEVFDVNVIALCIATQAAIKDMKANNVDGHIVHINSISGHRVSDAAIANVYPASKYAVTALTETLRQELNLMGSKIKVTSVSPGLVKTEIFEASEKRIGKEINPRLKQGLEMAPILQANDVADVVMFVLGTPPHVQVHELMVQPIGQTP